MFLGLVALSALILALVSRRPVKRLMSRRFSHIELLWIGAMLHLLFVPAALSPTLGASLLPGLPKNGGLVYTTSLFFLLAFCWLNRRNLGIMVIGLGLLLNTLVISANGGQMPVDPGKLAANGILEEMLAADSSSDWGSYTVAGEVTRLRFLGDQIMVPRPILEPVILSVGDLVIACGIVLFIMVIPEVATSGARPAADAVSTV